nr:MAG: RNA-dependent RNA polymerase [Nairoviridae sp.]
MGIINLKAPVDHSLKEDSAMRLGKSSESTSSRSARSDRKLWDARSKGRESVMSISSTLEAFADVEQEGQYALRERDQCTIYQPSVRKVMKECKRLLVENPNYTMGIGEVMQAMVEFTRSKFPEVVVCHAKRDPKNWASIASVSESTAIVPGPLRRFDIQQCMESMKRMECTKLKKLLKNRLTHLGGPEAKIKNVKTVAKELEELLSCIDVVDEGVKKAVEKGISMARQLKQVTWEQASEMQLEQTVLTDDGHNIYYWLKNLKNAIEKFWKTPEAKELYNEPLNIQVVSVMRSISRNEKPSLTVEEIQEKSGDLFQLWIQVFDELVFQLKLIKVDEEEKFREEFLDVLDNYANLYNTFREILVLKRQNPDLSYQKMETNLRYMEDEFLANYSTRLGKYINFLFCACLSCPWSRGFRYQESVYLKTILTTIGLNLGDLGGMEKYIKVLLPTMGVRQFLSTYFIQRFECNNLRGVLEAFFRYAIAIYSSNSKPMSYVYNSDIDSSIQASHTLIQGVQDVIARSSLSGFDYDFAFTIKIVAYGSHAVAQKLTGKSKKERLPRSIRSKVIYEIIKLMGTSGSAILQEVAFEKILDTGHKFFATLAPKAQLGGNRDLFVQETGTKLIHATTEIFSKTLLSQTNDDGLTNSKLKEEILNKSLQQFKLSEEHHGRVLPRDKDDVGGSMINFYKVMTVAGDNTKWGPIHCCSFFSLMYQQLLLDHPDWKHYIMLVMLKDLYKEVEIPTASISKILNSLKHDEEFIKNYKTNTSHKELSSELLRICDKWSWKPLVQDIINNYLSKGVGCLRCYNHMGQGIHHATSSLLTSMLAELVKEIVGKFVESELAGLHCTIVHAGSSDDYAKVIITNGTLMDTEFDDACMRWKHVMLDAKNLMAAISRLVQVKDSSKTLSGTIVAEFYSEFVLYHRASPAGIKFIVTSLINSSITSPITMSQACQVSSQQAFFNSVPHLTNLSFTLFRQQVYFNYVENFIRKFGPITLGSVCSIGRLYLPKISNMLESGLVIEDIEQTVHSLKNLYTGLKMLPEEDFIVAPPGSVHSENISDSDDSEFPVIVDSSLDSDLKEKVKPRIFVKALDAGIATEFEKHITKSTESQDVVNAITKLQNSAYFMECDKIVRLIYNGHNCKHHSKLWHDQLLTRFIKPQPEIVKSLCIPSSGSTEFEMIRVDDISYSTTLIEVLMRDILVAVMFSHYKKPDTLSFGKRLKASYDREESSFYEDPFIQIKPNSLEREMKNIREAHDVVKSIVSNASMANTLSAAVSSCLVKMNNMTEDHLGETERLMQAIRSRSIVWGLSGGLKELSVPMYSIFMNGFFFLDNAKICTEARWASSRREGHMDSVAGEIGQRPRSKFTFWLDTVLSGRLRNIERNFYGVLDSRACVAWFNSMVEEQEPEEIDVREIDDAAVNIPELPTSDTHFNEKGDVEVNMQADDAETETTIQQSNLVRKEADEEDPLSIPSLQRIIKIKKKLFISLDTGLCEKYAKELVSLSLQFSNVNRQKILSLETNQNLIIRPADYTTIVKTKLFNKGSTTQTNNNPAVVVAYKLCPESVYSLKPAGVDYSNLSIDGLTIADIHPAISEMCLEIIGKTTEACEFNNEEVHEYTRTLTSLCRLASSHRYSTMSFYAIRPTESSEETNLVEVISYGLQEGKQITFPVANIDMAAYSERFYVILEAIGCINQLPLLNDCKTTIMQNFLTWIPDKKNLEVPESCAFSGYCSSLLANFGGSSLASVLLAEQHLSHSQSVMRNCGYLSQFVMGAESLQSKIPYTGTKPTFFTEGSKTSHGNFRYFSPDGNAAGIFVSKKLLIHIDKLSALLMDNVCRHVLMWISGHKINQLTEEDIKQFLFLLPICQTSDLLVQDKGTGELCHIIKTGSSFSALEVRKGGIKGYPLVYFIENHMRATFEKEQERQPIMCEWQSDKLLLYYQVIHDEVKPSESNLHSISILLGSGLNSYAQVMEENTQSGSDKIVIATIPLSGVVNFKSMGLLHLYLSHIQGHRSHGLGVQVKEAELHRLSTDMAVNQLTKLKRDFKAYYKKKEQQAKKRRKEIERDLPQSSPDGKTEKMIRDKLNAVSEHYDRLIDWAAVQNIVKVLSMENSTVIAESLHLRNRVRWKVVPSSLDPSLLQSEEGQLFRACMELSSLRVRPIFCRLSFTESGCSQMMDLSVKCKAVLQSEGLTVGSLNIILFCAVLYNSTMSRGENGIMTINECFHGTLPFTHNISSSCTMSCNLEDGTPNMVLTITVPVEERGEPSSIAVLLSEPFRKANISKFGEIWRIVSANLTDKKSTSKDTCFIRYNVTPSLLAKFIPFSKMVKLFFNSYNGTAALGLCCSLLQVLLDNDLVDQECCKLALEFKNVEDRSNIKRVYSGEVVKGVASGEDILKALELLDRLEDDAEAPQLRQLTEQEMDDNDERERLEALASDPYE